MDFRNQFALVMIVLCMIVPRALSQSDSCDHNNADPLQGRETNEKEYPKEKIQEALNRDREIGQKINIEVKKWEALSQVTDLTWLPPSSSVSLCSSKFVQIFTTGWYFGIPNLGQCWVLHHFWKYPLSYVDCKTGKCQNMPCDSKLLNYNCVAANYKTYTAWTWCTKGGFQLKKFSVPQCCECRKFIKC